MRRGAACAVALLLSASVAAEPASPPNQTLVFYNARVALREERATDALKLWLLRNSLTQRGERGLHDEEFRSVVWAALGSLGLCQDGFPRDDEGGAGLWPLALHNWLVQSLSKGPLPDNPPPWDVFEVGRQQRLVSLNDVLSAEELRSVEFFRTTCVLPYSTLGRQGLLPWSDLEDRLVVGWALRQLLLLSRETLVLDKVRSVAAIDARLFDLDLVLAELQARRARSQGRESARQARALGVSARGAAELREATEKGWPESSPQAAFLRGTLGWSAESWLSLSRQRRLFLFAQARAVSKDSEALERLVLDVVDQLVARRDGEELEAWVGLLEAKELPQLRARLTSGERGRRLLELEPSSGFRERSVIALHRGVALLEEGRLHESLRSFAFAMRWAPESREAGATVALARRWLSYVLSRYETTAEVVDTLQALVPRQEYNAVIEDLVWRAALRADARSFERLTASVQRGGSFDARIARLRPLSQGKAGELLTELRTALEEEPYAALRLVRQLLDKLEVEDGDVRRANSAMLRRLAELLEPMAVQAGRPSAHGRNAQELLRRTQAILDGLAQLDTSPRGQARALAPSRETFAGSIRLAPADALPWPFVAPQVQAPSPFTPFILEPVEWKGRDGARVFGWRIRE